MSESPTSAAKKTGLPAGSLVHVGAIHTSTPQLTLIHYTEQEVIQQPIHSIEEILPFKNLPGITWVHIEGLHDVALMDTLGLHFNIHSLVLEDILNTHQRPKLEDHDDYLFIVLKALAIDHSRDFEVLHEQISILLFKDVVFTFKEKPDSLFQSIIASFSNDKAKVRRLGSDYLTYVLMDAIVDEYFALQDTLEIGRAHV